MKIKDKRETKSGKVCKAFILLFSLLDFPLYGQSEAEDRHDEEYVVVHEYTHFDAHNHGPRFYALMDERLPG